MSDGLVLVTGANGFVGSVLVRTLVKQGRRVRAMVRKIESVPQNFSDSVEVVEGDITKPETLSKVFEGVTEVHHIAATFREAGISRSRYFEVNAEGTRHVLDASIRAGVKRVVHCSTVGVLSHIANPPADETEPYNPGDWYQESKAEGEKIALDYFRSGKIPGVVIRPAMIYGPGDMRTLKLFRMIDRGMFFYVGKGEAHVHWIDVRDLARAFTLAMEHTERNGEVYIIAGSDSFPLTTFVNIVAAMLKVKAPWLHLPVKPIQMLGSLCEAICAPFGVNPPLYRRRVDFYTKNRCFTSKKAAEHLGFSPALNSLAEIEEILRWYRLNGYLSEGRNDARCPSVMVRSLDGHISFWSQSAEKFYGWNEDQAVGKTSHSLLSTEFSRPLDVINRDLLAGKRWRGVLTHTTSEKKKISVDSEWLMLEVPTRSDPIVLEVNHSASEGKNSRGGSGSLLSLVTSFEAYSGELVHSLFPILCGRREEVDFTC